MATTTYVPLATVTANGSSNSQLVMSSIPQTYTDLVLVINGNTGSDDETRLRFNNDTGTNYSENGMYGDGSGGGAVTKYTSTSYIQLGGVYSASGVGTVIVQIMNYSNTTVNKTVLSRANSGNYVQARVSSWRGSTGSPEAINRIDAYSAGGNWSNGTTFTLYGIANATIEAPKATGGIITYDDTYYYHTFGASGTFTPQQNLTNVDYLVIAGGGGGTAAGGGAGGLRSTVDVTGGGGTLESKISLNSGTAYTITVGSGGNGGVPTVSDATAGGNSSIAGTGLTTITATGGGFARQYLSSNGTGSSGGSGAGSLEISTVGSTNTGGAGTSGQGYKGGDGTLLGSGTGTYWGGAGGGGAGSVGANGISYRGSAGTCTGGNGGAGASLPTFANVTGTGINTYYAGGGGGGAEINSLGSAGGSGGGGKGRNDSQAATAGATNTGSGGGGNGPGQGNGQNGGSGLVIIRYAKA